MKVKEILMLAAEFAGKADLAKFIDVGLSDDLETAEREKNILLRCFNLVETEIALEYKPLIFEEIMYAQDGLIIFDNLSKQLVDIVGIRDEFDNILSYKLQKNFLKTAPKTVKVCYSYLPEKKLANDDSDYKNTKVSAKALAMGTTCEFLLISGLYDDALLWDKRFKDSLLKVCGKKTKGKSLPVRRWFL